MLGFPIQECCRKIFYIFFCVRTQIIFHRSYTPCRSEQMEMPCRLTICKLGMAHSITAKYVLSMQIELSCQMVTHIAVQPDFIVEN